MILGVAGAHLPNPVMTRAPGSPHLFSCATNSHSALKQTDGMQHILDADTTLDTLLDWLN